MKKPFLDPQVKALLEVGFIKPIDALLLAMWIAVIVTAIFFWHQGTLTVDRFLILAFIQVTVVGVWAISVIYRTCFQIIMARSDINTMPEAAAKLAISYQLKK